MPIHRYPDKFCQKDPRWANVTLGNTRMTIGRVGCKTVCQTIGHNKIHPEKWLTPDQMAKVLKYTMAGLMYHDNAYPDMKFVKRKWVWQLTEELKQYIQSKDKFAIIAVNQNSHFVFPYYFTHKGLMIIDPWDGKIKLLTANYKPCGYELMASLAG